MRSLDRLRNPLIVRIQSILLDLYRYQVPAYSAGLIAKPT